MNIKWLGLMAVLLVAFAALWLSGPREFPPLALFIVGMGMMMMHRLQGSSFFARAARHGNLLGLKEATAQSVYLVIGAGLVGFAFLGAVLK